MAGKLIQECVDIYQLPDVDPFHVADAGAQITIGDLHGNAIKLLFMLVRQGIATNITVNDYNKFVGIYTKPVDFLTQDDLNHFNAILDRIQFNNQVLIRFIGDELADRGSNDYFTLKLLEKLQVNQVLFEILISNHGIEFIESYETRGHFYYSTLAGDQADSMKNLQFLIDHPEKNISKEEICNIVEKAYKPNLRAIAYSLSENQQAITLYTHAPYGLNWVEIMAEKLGIFYVDNNPIELANTIDAMNVKFLEYVKKNQVNRLYNQELINLAADPSQTGLDKNTLAPFELLTWNRRHDNETIHRPHRHHGYHIYFVHGHDSSVKSKKNIYNLDNVLGKAKELNIGQYTLLYSHEKSFCT